MSAFGAAITNDTLKEMHRYKDKTITQEDRAREAIRYIQAGKKNVDALNHALNLKDTYSDGVSTLCLLYNATGDTLNIVDDQKQDWHGNIYKEEPPSSFENGQWIAFLHVHPSSSDGSEAARVYRGNNINGDTRDFLVAWNTEWSVDQNTAYTEVGEKDQFPKNWDDIKKIKLEKASKMTKDETDAHLVSAVSIGGLTSSELICVMEHRYGPL